MDEWKKGNTQFFTIVPLYSVIEELSPPLHHFPLKICDPDDNQTLSTPPPPPSLPFSPAANKDWSQKQAGFKLDIKVSTFLVYDSIT